MRRRGESGADAGEKPAQIADGVDMNGHPAVSIQLRSSAWTVCMGGERKGRVVSPGTSVQAAISRQRAMTRSGSICRGDCHGVDGLALRLATDACFDVAVGLIGRHEDFVRIVLPES